MASPRLGSSDAFWFVLCAAGLLAWTIYGYPAATLALVAASLALGAGSLWSCRMLLGARAARTFLATGLVLGWLAEQAGATQGWLFGHYTYTEVLGPRLGAVPLVIPLMWFSLAYIGYVLASLLLWRQPVGTAPGWRGQGLTALAAAMIVTAFDLGADPYFVYVLKAWIMAKQDGAWFGETVRGFEGWMIVSFAIVAAVQALVQPRGPVAATAPLVRRAALLPVLVYAGMIAFQVVFTQPAALKVVAFFAMGIPALLAAAAWMHWSHLARETA